MIDIRTIQTVERSFNIENAQLQNQTLRKSNGTLVIMLIVTIAFAVNFYYQSQENEKSKLL